MEPGGAGAGEVRLVDPRPAAAGGGGRRRRSHLCPRRNIRERARPHSVLGAEARSEGSGRSTGSPRLLRRKSQAGLPFFSTSVGGLAELCCRRGHPVQGKNSILRNSQRAESHDDGADVSAVSGERGGGDSPHRSEGGHPRPLLNVGLRRESGGFRWAVSPARRGAVSGLYYDSPLLYAGQQCAEDADEDAPRCAGQSAESRGEGRSLERRKLLCIAEFTAVDGVLRPGSSGGYRPPYSGRPRGGLRRFYADQHGDTQFLSDSGDAG